MATTDLELKPSGALPRPLILGRLLRLLLGASCLFYVYGLSQVHDALIQQDGNIRPLLWNGILPGLFLVSYVVNIGYSRDWKKWPAIVSALILAGAAAYNWTLTGSIEGQWFAGLLWVWLIYVIGHLGLAFVLSAILATPGCEMRAFHHAWSKMTGRPTKEHHCPIGPLGPVDRWERKRFTSED